MEQFFSPDFSQTPLKNEIFSQNPTRASPGPENHQENWPHWFLRRNREHSLKKVIFYIFAGTYIMECGTCLKFAAPD